MNTIRPFLSCCLTAFLLLGATHTVAKEQVALNYEKIKWTYLKKDAEQVRKTQTFKKIAPKRVKKTRSNQRAVLLVKDFRKLNRKIVRTKNGSDKLVASFVAQYNEIESQADSLANVGGNAEGKGACMKECGDNFPGVGGGNGANRIACKLSCLVLGE